MSHGKTYAKLLGVAAIWGASWVAGRIVVSQMAPLAVASWRFFFAMLVLGGLLWRTGTPLRWSRGDWQRIAALGLTGIFLYNVCFFYGLRLIEAGRGALIVALTPATIAFADWLFFSAGMSVPRAAAIAVALFGCLLVITRGDAALLVNGGFGTGESFILGCVVFWTLYTFIGRKVSQRVSPLEATFGASLTGWLLLTATALADGSLFSFSALRLDGLLCIVFLGLLVTALSFTWYAEGVRDLGATRAGMFISLVPVFGVLLGALLLDERLTAATLIGGALVILGVTSLNMPAVPQPSAKEAP